MSSLVFLYSQFSEIQPHIKEPKPANQKKNQLLYDNEAV